MSEQITPEQNKSRYILIYLSIAFLLGIVCASLFSFSWLGLGVAAGIAILMFFVGSAFQRLFTASPTLIRWFLNIFPLFLSQPIPQYLLDSSRNFGLGLFALAFVLGGVRHQLAQPIIDTDHVAYYNDGEEAIGLEGIISAMPDPRDRYIQVEIEAESFYNFDDYEEHEVGGQVLVRLPVNGGWRYGDRVRVFGLLKTPPEDELFSYREYLSRNGTFSYMPYATAELVEREQGNLFLATVFSFRQLALDKIYQLWPDPEASLLAGILLGIESGIPDDVENAFINTGTSHIIAISGFNFTILAGLMITLFSRWLGPRRGAVLAGVMIAVYAILVGASAAVVRAALMGGLGLFARQVGRRQDGLTSLSFVAVLMALWNPFVLWDVGFQLSYAATFGLIVYVDPLTAWFERLLPATLEENTARQITDAAGEYFLFTIAAQITTLPIIIYHFQRLSIISLPANFAILPAQSPIMIVGGLAVLLSFLVQPLGQVVAYITWPFVAFTIRMVEFFDRVPGGNLVVGEPALWHVVLFYGLLALITVRWAMLKEKLSPQWKPVSLFAGLFVLAVLVWQSVFHAPDGLLHVTLIEVEAGVPGSVLVQTPTGRYLLINGGGSVRELSDELGRRLPVGNRKLDWLLISESEDGWDLVNIVPRFPPQQVLWINREPQIAMANNLASFFVSGEIPVLEGRPAQRLDLGQGATLEVVSVGALGGNLIIRWDSFEVFIPAADRVQITGGTLPELDYDWVELVTDGTRFWVQGQR